MFKLNNNFWPLLIIIVYIINNALAEQEFTETIPKCHQNDNECITNAVTYFARNYPNGMPSIGIPVLEPLFIPRVDMIRETEHISNLQSINDTSLLGQITQNFVKHPLEYVNWKNRNLQVYGLQNTTYTVTGFENNLNTTKILLKMLMPNFTMSGEHDLHLKFLSNPINGSGQFKFSFENIEFRYSFVPVVYEKDGKQYMNISQPVVDYTITNVAEMNFGSKLLDGIKTLNSLEQAFLKTNGRILIDALRSESCPELAREFTNIINPIFNRFSIDQMFLLSNE